jgi:hypothetical protein
MSSEIENKEFFELNKSNYQQPASNNPAYSSMMQPNVQPYPINLSYPNNMYPNKFSQIQMPNDVTKELCSSIRCSVFNLICCFFWIGIPAVIFSCRAKENVDAGRLVEAQSDAKIAKIMNIVGICLGSLALAAIIIWTIVASTTTRYYYYYSYD